MNKKILYLPKWFPCRKDEYLGNFIQAHAEATSPYADISILFVHSEENQTEAFDVEESTIGNMEVIKVYYPKPKSDIGFFSKISSLILYFKAQKHGYQILATKFGKPDLVHVHVLTRSALLAVYLNLKSRIPFIISEHFSGYFPESGAYKGFWKKLATKWVVRFSKAITTVSIYLKENMVAHGLKKKYYFIPNVFDENLFYRQEKKENKNRKIKIVHISTLETKPKNLPKILMAIQGLSEERQDFELHIIGDGPEGSAQKNVAKKLGILDSFVFFHGNNPKEYVAKELREADFSILFSLYENQPCVLIESFACGVPAIAPRVGGIPEILDQSNGYLCEVDNLEDFGKKLRRMMNNYQNFNRDQIAKSALKRFGNESVGMQFSELYDKILSR